MSFQYPGPGANATAEYMASGLPWVSASTTTSGSVKRIDFPYVTSFFSIKHAGGAGSLTVGFTVSGTLGSNNFTLAASGAFAADMRIKTLFLTATSGTVNFELVAGLTVIQPHRFPTLTGSSNPGLSASMTPVFGYDGLG